MATQKKSGSAGIQNSGFAGNSQAEGSRLTNRDGSVNLRKTGMPFYQRISIYHTLLRMDRWKFFFCIFLFYTFTNLFFASIYFLIGTDQLEGTSIKGTPLHDFITAFFFSSQTLTTVGYGHISPVSFWSNLVASMESFIGILTFALVTGLLYARFTRPRAYLIFSDCMVVAPHKEGQALMFRTASTKNNHLTDAEATVTIVLHNPGSGKTDFFPANLEIPRVNSLALSWTIVHPIDDQSPLQGMTGKDLTDYRIELIVSIKAFDDHFSNIVQQRTSYTYRELAYGYKFSPMFHRSEDGALTILELDQISNTVLAPVPEPVMA